MRRASEHRPPLIAQCKWMVELWVNSFTPGESVTTNTDTTATDGFARTFVSRDPIKKGRHKISLACAQLSGNVKIDVPTIAAIALNAG